MRRAAPAALRRAALRAALLCACAAVARCQPSAAALPLLPAADAPHVVAAAAAAAWHPHRFHHDGVAHPHTVLTGPEATAASLVLRPAEEGAASGGAATASAAPAGGKARTGLAPEGVTLDAALASATKLQPGAPLPRTHARTHTHAADAVCAQSCSARCRRLFWRGTRTPAGWTTT
jgi:hypothetical protein